MEWRRILELVLLGDHALKSSSLLVGQHHALREQLIALIHVSRSKTLFLSIQAENVVLLLHGADHRSIRVYRLFKLSLVEVKRLIVLLKADLTGVKHRLKGGLFSLEILKGISCFLGALTYRRKGTGSTICAVLKRVQVLDIWNLWWCILRLSDIRARWIEFRAHRALENILAILLKL